MSKISSKKYKSIWLYHLKNGDITYYVTHKVNGKTKWVKVGRKFEGVTEKKAFDYKNSLLLKKDLELRSEKQEEIQVNFTHEEDLEPISEPQYEPKSKVFEEVKNTYNFKRVNKGT